MDRRLVADHFAEAFRTLRKLPPVKAQGYFNRWPEIVRPPGDRGMEPRPMRVWPSTAAITRLEQTFNWVLWITSTNASRLVPRGPRAVEADQLELGCTARPLASLAAGADQDRCAAECK